MIDLSKFTPPMQSKIKRSIKLLQSIPNSKDSPVEVCYSGGKDSDIILRLTQEAGVHYRAIYKCTTIDPPGTIKHCKSKGVEVLMPKRNFRQIVSTNGLPNRFRRFCCSKLKEYKVLDKNIQGIRRSESTARKIRYSEDDPVICREYQDGGHADVILPILSWTDSDVYEFVTVLGIKCHPLYYDENGVFHPERRLGCIGCPLQSGNGLKDFKKYPKMYVSIAKKAKIWWDNHKNAKSHTIFHEDFWQMMACNLLYKSINDFEKDNIGQDWKKVLEEEIGIDLSSI